MAGSVAAVLPLYDEAGAVGRVVRSFPEDVLEVIVVDDGSDDGGANEARAAGARVIPLGARRGIGVAIRTGLLAARAAGHSAVVVMAANGKDDPRETPRLLARLEEGCDYVQGSRFLPGGSHTGLPWSRWLMIRGYTLVFRVLTGFRGTDVTNGFRAYRLALLDDPRVDISQGWLDGYELEYYIHWKAITLGYRVCEVAVSKTYPSRGRYSKIRPILDWWRIVRPVLFLALRIRR